ncbi:type II toxin-antitoxin system VapC family toxin [Leptolyngbya sp. AN03gr2]|uniref:type II toxin-antitoxin system VapC family toxin n=1 Tax=unclassified Leptolyngbya TaxID=2650499 RepID=UPI003D31A79F
MNILVDTNVWLRLAQPTSQLHPNALRAINTLHRQPNLTLCIVPQTLIEFWVVATRPLQVNGLGLTASEAVIETRKIKRLANFYENTPECFIRWEELVDQYQVLGKTAHDTHLVASMIVHQITDLLTLNPADFQRYSEIRVIDPRNF